MAAKTESPLDEIYRLVQQDMHNYSHVVKEFPLTTMSRAVANAIWHLDLASGGPVEAAGKALDVGTGSGIHAFVAARKGFSQVTAIDVNEKAVELAYARAGRFGFSAHLAHRRPTLRPRG